MIKYKVYLSIFILILISIFLLNYRYPFITEKIGKWSVGYGSYEHLFQEIKISSKKIISYEDLDSILGTVDNYIADPFFIYANSTFYLFVELKGEENADIALFISEEGLNYKYKGVVLNEAFHLSYPQVFKYKEEYYMLPETKQSGNVLLYKAEEFPYKWKLEDTLIENVKLKDPSILLTPELNLIVTVDDHMNQLLFTADSLKGQWKEIENYTPKKGNETRPGGRFFNYKNEWYLPVQDRSFGYGSGISLFKLNISAGKIDLQLSKSRYLHQMNKITWFNRGMHHLDIQKIDNLYYMVYDGDRNNNGEKALQIKRTLKFIYSDFYNYFNRN